MRSTRPKNINETKRNKTRIPVVVRNVPVVRNAVHQRVEPQDHEMPTLWDSVNEERTVILNMSPSIA